MSIKKRLLCTVVLLGVLCLGTGASFAQPPEEFKIPASDGAAVDYFGYSVSISGDVAIVGAVGDDDKGSSSGSAYVYRWDGVSWIEEAKLTASDGARSDQFGYSVSISGDVAIVGAVGDDDKGSRSGSAYVFRFDGDSWGEEHAKLTASDGAGGDQFGVSVSISGDVVIVGAHFDADAGFRSGSAYVFRFDETKLEDSWVQEDKLTASDGAARDNFGVCVSISGDVAIVGSRYAGFRSGSAYVFRFDETKLEDSWVQEDKLTASDGAGGDYFGVSVSISGDVAIVGASGDDDNGGGSGSAYVYRRDPVSLSWMEEAKLTASDGAGGDWFGYSVSISGDAAIVGAFLDDDNGSASGSAYVFGLAGGSWMEEAKLTASDGTGSEFFGYSVSISGDVAIVGERFGDDNGNASGSAYIYRFHHPNCSAAAPSIAELWPANHKMVDVEILGVTDPDGDPVSITITGITQDEPVDDAGDGNFEPDGAIVGTSTAQVRAERQGGKSKGKGKGKGGSGNGRVYEISFVASDGKGGECAASVTVCVPHDQGKGSVCVDDGQFYDAITGAPVVSAAKPVVIRDFHPTDPSIPDELKELLGLEGLEGLWLLDPESVDGLNAQGDAIEQATVQTLQFELAQNHPNPFNPATTIQYTLSEATQVHLTIYNILGQSVRVLVNGGQGAGVYGVTWDGRDTFGKAVTSGVYLYRLKAGANVSVRRMILVK
jgi:hypothetical protein